MNQAFSKIWIIVILLAIFMGLFAWRYSVLVALTLSLYIYLSLVLMALTRKAQTGPSWIAWIPIINLYLLSKIAKMHWWPILLFIYGFGIYVLSQEKIIALEPGTLSAILLFGSSLPALLVFGIFVLIWLWRTFENVGSPGWWALLGFIPIVGPILLLVLLGIAAWRRTKESTKEVEQI